MKLGVQLRPWLIKDPRPGLDVILAEARQAGYYGIEAGAQFFEWARPQDLHELTRNTSLKVAGIHVGGEIFSPHSVAHARENLPAIASFTRQTGADSLLFSGFLIEQKPLVEMDAELQAIQLAAYQCADLGVTFCYHNHWWEIAEDCRELRYYRDHTDPQLVSFCLDIGWAHRGGCDPIAAIDLLGERIKSVHLRDATPDHEWRSLDRGVMNLSAILHRLEDIDLDWVIIETDDVEGEPYAAAAESREYLAALVGW